MVAQILNKNYRMKNVKDREFIEAIVPGSVYTDLLRAGKMKDPFYKDQEEEALKLMEEDYEYVCEFEWEKEQFEDCDKILLHFDGIDTVSEVYLNGNKVGEACNMHREWEFDVTGQIRERENELRVILHSPLRFIREANLKYGTKGSEDAMEGFMHLRKAHCMFGWDWGAHLPDAGIFRPVSLLGMKKLRIDNVRIHQVHKEKLVALQLLVETEPAVQNGSSSTAEYHYEVRVTAPNGTVIQTAGSPKEIVIDEPQLWWPNGIGEQPLYEIEVKAYADGEEVDSWKRRIGLRTCTIHKEKDEWGESFAHEVNGVQIFAMGADYIPEDHLLGRTSREKTYDLLLQCKRANFNVIRVWGGGYYPEDWFFDACDEMGLLVWQDFMFACSVYELTPEFEANIREEFIDNIKRIRHHASLGLWCGNNEMEMFVDQRAWVSKQSEIRDYLFMYERIIPEVLREHDPDTFYWPASPSSGGSFDEPNDPDRGDVHYWEVWHGNKPFSEYRRYYFRYISEFGFQALPAKKTLEQITDDPEDMNLFSYIMEKHQRNSDGNGKIVKYMQQMYRYPGDFDKLIYASQLLQADGIRYGVEHFRRNRGRCMGAVYWQLNDCWPVISWSSIDYFGRWKALHYYAARFFAPVMISCEEQNWMTSGIDMNHQHTDFEKSIRLNVTNETRERKTVTVRWALRNADASIVRQEEEAVTVEALSSVWLEKVLLPEANVFDQYVSFEAAEGKEILSQSTVIFSFPKYFRYLNPMLRCSVEGEELVIKAAAYAKSVEILNENEDLILSDNYFDMNAGERRIRIISGKPEGIRLRSVYDIR